MDTNRKNKDLKIGEAFIYLDHAPSFQEHHIYCKVYIERIVYGPDIVLASDGKWYNINTVIIYRDLYEIKRYDLSIFQTIERNPKNMLIPLPKDINA